MGLCPGPRFLGGPHQGGSRPAWGSFSSDDSGQLLPLAGVFLMLGVVTMGSTVVLLNNLEGDTQRGLEGIHADADQLTSDLNATLKGRVSKGVIAVDYFQNLSAAAEQAFMEKAANAGLYGSIELAKNPPPEAFRRSSRCLGYDPNTSAGGVIVGWERDSRRLGIAGAVYDLRMTDGRETLRTLYYLKIFDCLDDMVATHQTGHVLQTGRVVDDGADRQADGSPMGVLETTQRVTIPGFSTGIDGDSYDADRWNHPARIATEDRSGAVHASTLLSSNHLQWRITAPAMMQEDDRLLGPTVSVVARHEIASRLLHDQNLTLNVYYPFDAQEPWRSEEISPLQSSFEEFELGMETGPSGAAGWSKQELEQSLWELTVVGGHNEGRTFFVDFVGMTGDLWTWSAYDLNATFTWEPIPPVYTTHDFTLVYRIDPGTPGERFELHTRDVGVGGNSTWWSLGTLEDTQGGWGTLTTTLDLRGDATKELEFRFIDHADDDPLVPDDEDTIEVDLMRVESRMARS